MIKRTIRQALFTALTFGAALTAGIARSDTPLPQSGTAAVYRGIEQSSVEQLTPPARIISVAMNGAPTAIWQALEHGEKVECVECIPYVSKLLFDARSAKNREIAAWWLRRRIFGVFGAGQIYQEVTQKLASDPSPSVRAFAAEALGEFLAGAGVPNVATALTTDSAPVVRAAAARALGRLNSQGPNGELGKALADADETVRLEALTAAMHINVVRNLQPSIARLISDSSPAVRRHAAAALGAMRARDAVTGLIALTSPANEADAATRAAAVFSLGQIRDSAARDAVQAAMSDTDSSVRDAAAIALRRL